MVEWKNHDLVEILHAEEATQEQKRRAIDLLLGIYESKQQRFNSVDQILADAEIEEVR